MIEEARINHSVFSAFKTDSFFPVPIRSGMTIFPADLFSSHILIEQLKFPSSGFFNVNHEFFRSVLRKFNQENAERTNGFQIKIRRKSWD